MGLAERAIQLCEYRVKTIPRFVGADRRSNIPDHPARVRSTNVEFDLSLVSCTDIITERVTTSLRFRETHNHYDTLKRGSRCDAMRYRVIYN